MFLLTKKCWKSNRERERERERERDRDRESLLSSCFKSIKSGPLIPEVIFTLQVLFPSWKILSLIMI